MLEKEFTMFKDILNGNILSKDKKNIYTEELVKERFAFFHDFTISMLK
jgi:hypothetical protein